MGLIQLGNVMLIVNVNLRRVILQRKGLCAYLKLDLISNNSLVAEYYATVTKNVEHYFFRNMRHHQLMLVYYHDSH